MQFNQLHMYDNQLQVYKQLIAQIKQEFGLKPKNTQEPDQICLNRTEPDETDRSRALPWSSQTERSNRTDKNRSKTGRTGRNRPADLVGSDRTRSN